MADSIFPTLVSKDANPNSASDPIYVELSDGTNPLTTLPVSIAGNVTVVQSTGTNLHVVVDAGSAVIGHVITDTGSTTAVTGNVTVVQPTGTNLHVAVDGSVAVTGTFWQTTQPVSGSVSVSNFPALQDVNVAKWNAVAVGSPTAYGTAPGAVNVIGVNAYVTNTVPVTGTFWQTTQPVSGTFWQATQPISAVALPLPAGASTSALQTTGNSSLSSIDGKLNTLGQKTMAGSVPVTMASDQSPLRISATTAANSAGNPIYVQSAVAAITGAICDYATATVTANSTSNHDYTVVTSMLVKSVSFACSGGGKVELKVGPVASLVSKWVGFIPTQGGEVKMVFDPPILVPTTSTGTVRLAMTNRQNQSQDLYSTIVGVDA
jgi:hypothetical protein